MISKLHAYMRRICFGLPSDEKESAPVPSSDEITVKRLNHLTESCAEFLRNNPVEKSVRVLIPTTFNLSKSFWAHDGIMINALRLRGVDVVTTICDRLQGDECMLWSGVWQDSGKPGFSERRKRLCAQCVSRDIAMCESWGLTPLRLTSYVTDKERDEGMKEAEAWVRKGDWKSLVIDGYPAGFEAWKAVVNNDLQAEITPEWRKRADQLAVHHLYNIRQLLIVYERVLSALSINRIFGNGTFYYTWGTLQHVAEKLGVSYHRYYKNWASHPLGWNYASNSHDLVDLRPAWASWLKQTWSDTKEERIANHFENRGLSLSDYNNKETVLSFDCQDLAIDYSKPTLLVPTGVAWDAYTNQRSELYPDMCTWLWGLFEWFAKHPEYQAIIRTHPNEDYSENIGSDSRIYLEREIQNKKIQVPSNVIVVPNKHPLSTYDLVKVSHVAAVYTSTTGLELACVGCPVISVGPSPYRGFGISYDPSSRAEYFNQLQTLLESRGKNHSSEKVLNAKKYWYLWAYHSTVITGLLELVGNDKNGLHMMRELGAEDLLPGANEYLDYLVNAIVEDQPILGDNRWPPERHTRYDSKIITS